jgi:hypothetical protein
MSYRFSPIASRRRPLAKAIAVGLTALAGVMFTSGAAQAATLPTVTATVSSTSISVSGALQSGAVNIASTATGGKEPSVVLVKLNPGVSAAEVFAFLASNKPSQDPNTISKYGSIVFDAEASAGQKSEVQTDLVPGQYVALGASGEGGPKVKMPFTVTAAANPAVLPTPQAIVRSIDFGFKGPATLHDGEIVRFENEGFVVHMDVAFPAKSRAAATKIVHGLLTGHEKGLEKLVSGAPFGFAGPLSHEAFVQETITAKPGWYVQACFMETEDGRDHTRLGMERIIKITK